MWAPLQVLPPSPQSVQGAPLAPHAVSEFPGKHVVPSRHPVQMHCFNIEQVSPFAVHETQALPPPPHALSWFPGLQVLPVQQPAPQDVMVQTHVPVPGLQACPTMQACPTFCHWPHALHWTGC